MAVERVTPKPGMQKALGERIVGWTMDKSSLPERDADGAIKDVAAFRAEMADLVDIPESVTRVVFVVPETDCDGNFTYFIRLPLKELVESSRDELRKIDEDIASGQAPGKAIDYPGLSFYEEFIGTSPINRAYEDMLYRRIADYTFAHCK